LINSCIGGFDNSAGTTFSIGNDIAIGPLLDVDQSGAGTGADPTVITYAYEFSSAQMGENNLPDPTVEKAVSCFMSSVNLDHSTISASDELTSQSHLTLISDNMVVPSSGNGSGNGTTDTSDAMSLAGQKTGLAFMALLWLMAVY